MHINQIILVIGEGGSRQILVSGEGEGKTKLLASPHLPPPTTKYF